jgi:adenylate cyclase class 2
MDEIEVKIFGVDIENIKKKVLKLGGTLAKKENQENYFYDFPPHMKDEKGYIRIRKIHNLIDDSTKIMMCMKRIISQDTARKTEEHEFEVLDFKEAEEFLKSMGIGFFSKEDKYRESYLLSNALIEIDIWDKKVFPEPYIEVEAESEKKIYEILSILGIPAEKATSKSLNEIKKTFNLPARVKA